MVLVGTSIYQIATFKTNADGEGLVLSLPSYSANEDMPHLFQNTTSKPMVQFLHFYSHGCLVLTEYLSFRFLLSTSNSFYLGPVLRDSSLERWPMTMLDFLSHGMWTNLQMQVIS